MTQRIRIRIYCHHRPAMVLLLTLVSLSILSMGVLLLSYDPAAAEPSRVIAPASIGPRAYYLTSAVHDADEVLDACATGYHTAALWEIADTTMLRYDGTLGQQLADSGSGPPAGYYGWVRTGYLSSSSITAGRGNCLTWASTSGIYSGTRMKLPTDWSQAAQYSSPWEAEAALCSDSTTTRVWCVANSVISERAYLPVVVKNEP